jgi:hypothetical protein
LIFSGETGLASEKDDIPKRAAHWASRSANWSDLPLLVSGVLLYDNPKPCLFHPLAEKILMVTTKRTPPPKLVDDINVTAISEPKTEKSLPEAKPSTPKAPAKKTSTSPNASPEPATTPVKSATASPAKKATATTAPETKNEETKKSVRSEANKASAKSGTSAAESKPAAKAPAPKKGVSAPTQAELDRLIQDEIKHLIEEAAYYLAEKRNFQPGHEQEDWATATAEVLAKLRSGEIS